MEPQRKQPFSKRAFVALAAAFAGLGLPVTGVANHIHQMDQMTVQRHAWMSAHNILGFLFVVFSVWHVILNRRALWKYAGGLAERLPKVSREAVWAAVLVAVVLVVVVGHALHAGQQ
jgi:hypothetical protein